MILKPIAKDSNNQKEVEERINQFLAQRFNPNYNGKTEESYNFWHRGTTIKNMYPFEFKDLIGEPKSKYDFLRKRGRINQTGCNTSIESLYNFCCNIKGLIVELREDNGTLIKKFDTDTLEETYTEE